MTCPAYLLGRYRDYRRAGVPTMAARRHIVDAVANLAAWPDDDD